MVTPLSLRRVERLLLDRKPMGAGVDRGLLRGVQETVAQLRIHALERRFAEIDRERREDCAASAHRFFAVS